MSFEDQVRQTLHDWAAEAPLHGARAVPQGATRPRSTARRRFALAAGLIVAVGAVAVATSALDDDPPPLVQTTEPPPVLRDPDWDAEQYHEATEAIRSAPTVSLDLDDIAEGVTLDEIEGVPVYIVRRGDELTVLLPTSPYDGTRITYCRTSGWFEAPTHGEKWDETGAPANDVARRGLSRVPAVVDGDEAVIDLSGLTPGAPAEGPPTPQPAAGPQCLGPSEDGG